MASSGSGSFRKRLAAGAVACLTLCGAGAAHADVDPQDLSSLSIDELANLEITSVSRRAEPLSQAPASVYVISNADIRRSGVQTLPEALRLAPNLDVARLDALSYAISARGFNSFQSSNKLLVLIDGRSVYTQLFSGVFWEQQNVLLEDLARIEVISGPGGTLYGANAVNGVINVISKDAHETQGVLVSGAAGNEQVQGSLRYGGRFGGNGAFRVYATAFDRGNTLLPSGADAGDGWNGYQAGFRADWGAGENSFTVQGDVYDYSVEAAGSLITPGGSLRGQNLIGRWNRRLGDRSSLQIQAYYDNAERPAPLLSDARRTLDLLAQYDFPLAERHQVVVGGGYRWTEDEFINRLNPFVLDPESRQISLGNVFVQDTVRLSDSLTLIAGVKLEDSDFTELQVMPNLRLAWQPTPRTLLWASVSRAVRNPSRIDRELVFPGLLINGIAGPESVVAYEAGYRGQPIANATLSVSVYFNQYDDLRTNELTTTPPIRVFVGNGAEGETYGLEAWGAYDLTDRWRISAGVNLLGKDLQPKPGVVDLSNLLAGGNDPDAQGFIRSQWTLPHDLELDVRVRAVGERPRPRVPGYVEADARIGWRGVEGVELYLAGFNLFDAAHPEDIDRNLQREIRRSVLAGARWSF
jgi:iron complex outermembrane recepter protein